jgi:hypothetical protein
MAIAEHSITDFWMGRDGDSLAIHWSVRSISGFGRGAFGVGAFGVGGGETFQVYKDRRLVWSGTGTSCYLPWPRSTALVQVVQVASDDVDVDHVSSGDLPLVAGSVGDPDEGNRAILTWIPPADPDLAGFRVYSGTAPGGAVDYENRLADINSLYPNSTGPGFGRGPFGRGPFGIGTSLIRWVSEPLENGTWNFAVRTYDVNGNEQAVGLTVSVDISAPPLPPAPDDDGRRLTHSVGPVTLHWLASPSA